MITVIFAVKMLLLHRKLFLTLRSWESFVLQEIYLFANEGENHTNNVKQLEEMKKGTEDAVVSPIAWGMRGRGPDEIPLQLPRFLKKPQPRAAQQFSGLATFGIKSWSHMSTSVFFWILRGILQMKHVKCTQSGFPSCRQATPHVKKCKHVLSNRDILDLKSRFAEASTCPSFQDPKIKKMLDGFKIPAAGEAWQWTDRYCMGISRKTCCIHVALCTPWDDSAAVRGRCRTRLSN